MSKRILLIVSLALVLIAFYNIGGYDKPSPVTGEVIFDIPKLIHKNIDQVMFDVGKTPESYLDSASRNYELVKSDSNSVYRLGRSNGRVLSGSFSYSKKGWVLTIGFDFNSRMIESVYIGSNTDLGYRRKGFFNEENLLLIGNLEMQSEDYYLTFQDFVTREYTLPESKIFKAYGVFAYPINSKRRP